MLHVPAQPTSPRVGRRPGVAGGATAGGPTAGGVGGPGAGRIVGGGLDDGRDGVRWIGRGVGTVR